MKPIYEILGVSPQEYEAMTQQIWLNWAEDHSANHAHWQNIIASASVNRWFWAEMRKLEDEFLRTVRLYDESSTVTAVDLGRCYKRCVIAIYERYPGPLINFLRPKQPLANVRGRYLETVFSSLNMN